MKMRTAQWVMAVAMILASTSAATAQTSYQAEEQAFRARQDEGARLHQTYGESSPQYQDWLRREKGIVPQSNIPNYQTNSGYYPGNSGSRGRKNRWKHNKSNRWNWDAHNWNDQRNYLSSHWRDNSQLSPWQQQQLDNQMRAQWLQYHQNRWQGATSWNQYNDPGFLNYLHNNNPSLMQQIRARLGF